VIKFVSDLRQIGGFLWVHRFPPPIIPDRHDITELLLKVASTPSNKDMQSASGPLTHLMSLHNVRGSIVINKEGVIRSQSIYKALSYGPMTRVSVQKVFVNPLSYGPMTMVCVHKIFAKPLSYGP
jgi:hypothetical protein